jgi:hypothetical protein
MLFGLIQNAIANKENYKALYLARIFNEIKPDLAAGWTNRAAIANSLGLKAEAEAAALRATDITRQTPVPLSVLPGSGLKVRPASLADWAASLALVGDSLSAQNGERSAVAVRDDISGVAVADPNEVREADSRQIAAGLTATGPWATAKPLQADLVDANLFVLKEPVAMGYGTVKKGMMFLGAVLAAESAMAGSMGVAGSGDLAQTSGQVMGNAFEVESNFHGGSYKKGVYDDNGKISLAKDKPKSAGKEYAVGNPLILLWASGPSLLPSYYGRWETRHSPTFQVAKADAPWNGKGDTKSENPPNLTYPRLQSLCAATCSKPVSLIEAILTPDEVSKLAPTLNAAPVDLDAQRQAYPDGKLTLAEGNANNAWVGFDDGGWVYSIRVSHSQPTGMLVEP